MNESAQNDLKELLKTFIRICERSVCRVSNLSESAQETSKSFSVPVPSYLWALFFFRVSNLSESTENDLQEFFSTFIFVSALCFQGKQPEWECPGERPPKSCSRPSYLWALYVFRVSNLSESAQENDLPRPVQDLHICERSIFSGWATWVRVPRRTTSKSCSVASYLWALYVFRVSNLSESAQENDLQEMFSTFIFVSALFSGWATWVRVPRRTTPKSCSVPSYLWALYVFRVSNLSESAQENDLQELFKPFGHIARIFLAKDKTTGQCKVIHSYSSAPVPTRKNSAQPVWFHLGPFRTPAMCFNSSELVPDNQSSSESVKFFPSYQDSSQSPRTLPQHVGTLPNPPEFFPIRQNSHQPIITLPFLSEHFPTRQNSS